MSAAPFSVYTKLSDVRTKLSNVRSKLSDGDTKASVGIRIVGYNYLIS